MSTVTINTKVLQEMTAKAIKGAGFKSLLLITSLIGIRYEEGTLILTTTDGTNYFFIEEMLYDSDDGDTFNVVLDADTFSKLISKTTSSDVTFNITDSYVEIKGNGSHKFELHFDDMGKPLVFPNPLASENFDNAKEIELPAETVKLMLDAIKPALADDGSCYSNYAISDMIVATNRYLVNGYAEDYSNGDDIIVSREFVDLLGLGSDKVSIKVNANNKILATIGSMTVFSSIPSNADSFKTSNIKKLLSVPEYKSWCMVKKSELMALLDRLALFVGKLDNNAIDLEFTESGIQFKTRHGEGEEFIEYREVKDHVNSKISISIALLQKQLKAYQSDSVEICYGNDTCLTLVDGTLTYITALYR